jgi:hypothetical protein
VEETKKLSRRLFLPAAALAAGGAVFAAERLSDDTGVPLSEETNAMPEATNGSKRVVGVSAPSGARQLFVTESGNDSNNGLSWATAKRTIQAAIDVLPGDGGRVDVGAGRYAPFKVPGYGTTVVGRGPSATQIEAPSPSATLIDVTGAGSMIADLGMYGGPRYGGVMLHCSAAKAKCFNMAALNDDATKPAAGFGGTGFQIKDCEGVTMFGCSFRKCRVGLDGANMTSCGIYNTHGDRNWQSLVLRSLRGEPGSGANLFSEWKTVGAGNGNQSVVVVDIGGGGQNTFMNFDVDEAEGNRVRVSSSGNEFIRFASAPLTFVEINGDHNIFRSPKFLEPGVVNGSFCEFWHPLMLNSGWTVKGQNNLVVYDNPGGRMNGPGIKRLVYA